MDIIKDVLKTPEGKSLATLLCLLAVGAAAEQAWWTYAAPKGALRCTETVTGIVCMHKK